MSVCLVENKLSAILNANGLNTAARLSGRWIGFMQAIVSALKGGEPTSWAFYRDDARSNVDLDVLRDLELLLRVDVQHLEKPLAVEKWRDREVREVDITAKEIRFEVELCALAGINLGAQTPSPTDALLCSSALQFGGRPHLQMI